MSHTKVHDAVFALHNCKNITQFIKDACVSCFIAHLLLYNYRYRVQASAKWQKEQQVAVEVEVGEEKNQHAVIAL